MANIRDRQLAAVKCMLNLGKIVSSKGQVEPDWKVLVYDQVGQDIISPLMSVADLRTLGVTLYLPLNGARDQVADVTAVYFVAPTAENVQRICADMRADLYTSYYLNFISAIPRSRLEEIAGVAIEAGVETKISKIFDQYVDFISLEKDMFTLNGGNKRIQSYYNLNKTDLKDHEIDSVINDVVNSLYCVFVTLGTIPIIRCPPGGAAEMIAERLDKRLRENLRDTRNSFFSSIPNHQGGSTGGSDPGPVLSFQRPLLLIVDRNIDLATPLHHTWTYQALVHDVLKLNLNSVTIPAAATEGGDAASSKKAAGKPYNLGPSNTFWQLHKGEPFPEVAESVQKEIEEYRSHEEEMQRMKNAMGGSAEGGPVDISDNTAKLTSAMSSLPELLEKKRQIDMHTTIATSILSCIKQRKLDEFFELEERIISNRAGAGVSDKAMLEFLAGAGVANHGDKMRLFLLYYICHANFADVDAAQFLELLQSAGCQTAAFAYIKRWKQFSAPINQSGSMPGSGGGGTKTIGMFSHLMSTGSQFVMEGVKNLVIKKHNLPITKVLDQLMELKPGAETDQYRYYDPKLARQTDTMARKTKVPYSNAIVFVVGGGNYIEYQNLNDYIGAKPGKQVSYGCMELLNAEDFLEQLNLLGSELQ